MVLLIEAQAFERKKHSNQKMYFQIQCPIFIFKKLSLVGQREQLIPNPNNSKHKFKLKILAEKFDRYKYDTKKKVQNNGKGLWNIPP